MSLSVPFAKKAVAHSVQNRFGMLVGDIPDIFNDSVIVRSRRKSLDIVVFTFDKDGANDTYRTTDRTADALSSSGPAFDLFGTGNNPALLSVGDFMVFGGASGADINELAFDVEQAFAGTSIDVRIEYLASDNTWKLPVNVQTSANFLATTGFHRVFWDVPADIGLDKTFQFSSGNPEVGSFYRLRVHAVTGTTAVPQASVLYILGQGFTNFNITGSLESVQIEQTAEGTTFFADEDNIVYSNPKKWCKFRTTVEQGASAGLTARYQYWNGSAYTDLTMAHNDSESGSKLNLLPVRPYTITNSTAASVTVTAVTQLPGGGRIQARVNSLTNGMSIGLGDVTIGLENGAYIVRNQGVEVIGITFKTPAIGDQLMVWRDEKTLGVYAQVLFTGPTATTAIKTVTGNMTLSVTLPVGASFIDVHVSDYSDDLSYFVDVTWPATALTLTQQPEVNLHCRQSYIDSFIPPSDWATQTVTYTVAFIPAPNNVVTVTGYMIRILHTTSGVNTAKSFSHVTILPIDGSGVGIKLPATAARKLTIEAREPSASAMTVLAINKNTDSFAAITLPANSRLNSEPVTLDFSDNDEFISVILDSSDNGAPEDGALILSE